MAILFQNKVNQAFVDKVGGISSKLGIDPNWLMFVMDYESGGTFSPTASNPKNCLSMVPGKWCCVGIIQFCVDKTGLDYKTIGGEPVRLSDLASMSAIQQLDYVYKFYRQGWIRPYLTSYQALYLATLSPAYLKKMDDDGFEFPASTVNDNPSLFKYGGTMLSFKKSLQDLVFDNVPAAFYGSFFKEKESADEPTETKKINVLRIYRREALIVAGLAALLVLLWFVSKNIFK